MLSAVGGRLRPEIKRKHPFDGLEEEIFLNLLRTADALLRELEQTLKAAGLSHTQYNVLRILRGAGRDGSPCGEIAQRMISRDPDMTRLLDRLENRALVTRARERGDRRVVKTRITAEGLRILRELDEPIRSLERRQLRHIEHSQLRRLNELLEEVRRPRK